MTVLDALVESMMDRCADVASVIGSGETTNEVSIGIVVGDETVGLVLTAEIGIGPDGRPAATLRGFDVDGAPASLTTVELDGALMVSP